MAEKITDVEALQDGFEREGERISPLPDLAWEDLSFTPAFDITVQELTVIVVLLLQQMKNPKHDFDRLIMSQGAGAARHFSINGKPLI